MFTHIYIRFLFFFGSILFPFFINAAEVITSPTTPSTKLQIEKLSLSSMSCCSEMTTDSNESTSSQEQTTFHLSDAQRQFRTRLLIGSYSLGMALYGYKTWWGKDVLRNREDDNGVIVTQTISNRSQNFKVNREGWLSSTTPNGGADKLGHAFSTYAATRLMTRGFEWAGHDRQQAAWLAGLTAGTVMLAVEVVDGYTEEYGFSPEDLVMNLGGVALGTLLESYPTLDDLFDVRFYYRKSDDAKRLGENDPVNDYSGQTYLLVTKASGIPWLRDNIVLRYLEFDIGYGSRGYQPNPGKYVDNQLKERFLYYGISINLSRLLEDTVFKSYHYPTVQSVSKNLLEYIQIPGTILLEKHRLSTKYRKDLQ